MSKKHIEKFRRTIKYVIISSQIIGLFTFKMADTKFESSRIRSFINILATLWMISMCIFDIHLLNIGKADLGIYTTSNILLAVTCNIFVVTLWICGVTNSSKVIKLLNAMMEVEYKFFDHDIILDTDKERKRILHHLIGRSVVLGSLLVYIAALVDYKNHGYVISEILRSFFLIAKSIACFQTISLVSIFRTRFKTLNTHIDNLRTSCLENRHSLLCTACDLHHRLWKLVDHFNRAFGLTLLGTIGTSFVTIVILSFFFTVNLQATVVQWDKIGILSIGALPFIIDLLLICNICYITAKEANRTGELIHKITTADHDIIDAIEMFSLQIVNHPVKFSAAGFFPIDHTLVFAIIGGVTTYIIILIQLAATLVDN